MSSVDTPGSETSAPIAIVIELMLYEAGMIANSLSSKAMGGALAQRLADEEKAAEGEGSPSFSFSFSAFEAGMALNGMSRSEDGSLDDVKRRLYASLAAKMRELGINPLDGNGGSVGGDQGTLGGGEQGAPLGGTDTPAPAPTPMPEGGVPDATGDDGAQQPPETEAEAEDGTEA